MRIESIEQKYITNPNDNQTNSEAILATQVIFDGVSSHCILSRLMIEALGRPGKDNDVTYSDTNSANIVSAS